MVRISTLIGLFLVICGVTSSFAQPPAPCTNGTQNTCKCSTSPVLCSIEELDGYTYQMTTFLHPTDGPYKSGGGTQYMCPGSTGTTSHNPTWFRFLAWCEDLELEVCYTNCVDGPACFGGSDFGIQAAVYSDCFGCPDSPPCTGPSWEQTSYSPPPYTFAVGCDTDVPGCVNNSCRNVVMTGLTLGHVYYFLVDGCCGSACDIEINVIGSCGIPEIEPFTEIVGPTDVCVGGNPVTYSVEKPDGANWIHWYLDGVLVKEGVANNTNKNWTTTWNTPGTYEVCVDASNQPCIPVTEDPEPFCITITVVDEISVEITGDPSICTGESNTLDAGPGFSDYEWSTGETTQMITVSTGGTYTVTVSDGASCSGSDDFIVTEISSPIATASSNSPVCIGGTIQLTGGGGSTYSWTGPNGFSSNAQNPTIPNAMTINAGTYSLLVTDGNGCTGATTVNVVVNVSPIGTASSNSPLCSGATLNLMASGGTSYVWAGPNGFSSNQQNPTIPDAQPVHSGTYSVTVTNASGCVHGISTNVVVNATPIAASSSNSPLCIGATLLLNATGGGTYKWEGPNGFSSTNQNPNIQNVGLNHSGTYAVTVTSTQGCSANTSTYVEVNENPKPTITGSNTFCVGGFSILGAGFGYQKYLWSNGAQTEEIYVDQAGTYSVTVTDDNGCTGSDDILITVGLFLNPEITGDSILCDGNTGILNAGGGFATYTWSTGETSQKINVTSNGVYSVTVTDGTGCAGSDEIEVITSPSPNGVASSNSPVCIGQTILLQASGGTSYTWKGPQGFQSNTQNPIIPNASAGASGTYTVIISNGGSCSDTLSVQVNIGNGFALTASADIPHCPGDTLFLYAMGGDTTYLWSGPDSFNSILQNPFIPFAGPENSGQYILSDTSAQGCIANDTLNIFIPLGPIPEITGNLFICNGEEATLDAGPGFESYFWSNGKRGRISTTTEPGIYWVLVTGGDCCIGVDSAEVVITNTLSPKIKGDTTVCIGEFSLLDAGKGYDTYLWSTGDTLREILVDTTGYYSVTVTNSSGCVGADTVHLTVYGYPQATFTSDPESCVDSCDGRLEIIPLEAGYTYLWSNGDTSQVINNLCSGVYLVTITSPGGCFAVQGSYVAPALQLNVTINEGSNTLIALPSGGSPPYSYLWNTGETTQSIPLSPGMHSVTVTDGKGCEQSTTILITNVNDVHNRGTGLILHPNPADGTLILSPLKGQTFDVDLTFQVFNAVGVPVTDGSIQRGDSPRNLNTSQWAPGGYMVQVRYTGGGSEVIPVVVVH